MSIICPKYAVRKERDDKTLIAAPGSDKIVQESDWLSRGKGEMEQATDSDANVPPFVPAHLFPHCPLCQGMPFLFSSPI